MAIAGAAFAIQVIVLALRVHRLRRQAQIIPTSLERQYRQELKVVLLLAMGIGIGLAVTLVQR